MHREGQSYPGFDARQPDARDHALKPPLASFQPIILHSVPSSTKGWENNKNRSAPQLEKNNRNTYFSRNEQCLLSMQKATIEVDSRPQVWLSLRDPTRAEMTCRADKTRTNHFHPLFFFRSSESKNWSKHKLIQIPFPESPHFRFWERVKTQSKARFKN